MLEIGASKPLLLREESLEGFGLEVPLRLLYASDLHLGWAWSRGLVAELERRVREACPGVVLLGGDLVDPPRGLAQLGELVGRLGALSPVWAVGGNHDRFVGVGAVRAAVERAGGGWLEGRAVETGGARLEGSLRPAAGSLRRVLCAHDPAVFPRAAEAGYRLVLAGHLHGGQCVIGSYGGRQYPGAWLNAWTGLRFERAGSTMLVSRGAADTLPLRWNCPREAILCVLR
ncbi:MAG: metallophosphoesterase [Elusimicrobia bacterium]|nr:metallophosphoesterase [Elusimicrobiota bacterium]